MTATRDRPPPIAPFARTLNRMDPHLARQLSETRNENDDGETPWLDDPPATGSPLNPAGQRIYDAYRESSQGLGPDHLERMRQDIARILSYPVQQQLANLQDRAIILDCTGQEEEAAGMRRELRSLGLSTGIARQKLQDALARAQPQTMAIALGFMQHIRQRAARQVKGLPPTRRGCSDHRAPTPGADPQAHSTKQKEEPQMTLTTDANWPHLTHDWSEWNQRTRTTFLPQAVMDAAQATASRQSQDPRCPNTLHIATPTGSITADAQQDGWLQINEVDLGSFQAWDLFWQRLKEIVDAHPEQDMMRLSPQVQPDNPEPAPEDQYPWDQSLQWEVFEYALEPMRTTQYPRATTDPMSYRAFQVDTPGGAVTFWNDGNGWTSVMEVDLPAQEAHTLRTRAQEFLAQHPTEHLRQG